jgi:phage terminase small subunit
MTASTGRNPPAHLSAEACTLWRRLRRDFVIDDGAGLALLRCACEALDRAQAARRQIDQDGALIDGRFGQRRAHPLLTVERDARAAMIMALRAMRLAPDVLEPDSHD